MMIRTSIPAIALLALAGCATISPAQEQEVAAACLIQAKEAVAAHGDPERAALIRSANPVGLTDDEAQRIRNIAGVCRTQTIADIDQKNTAANVASVTAAGAVVQAIAGVAIAAQPPPPAVIVVVPRRW